MGQTQDCINGAFQDPTNKNKHLDWQESAVCEKYCNAGEG